MALRRPPPKSNPSCRSSVTGRRRRGGGFGGRTGAFAVDASSFGATSGELAFFPGCPLGRPRTGFSNEARGAGSGSTRARAVIQAWTTLSGQPTRPREIRTGWGKIGTLYILRLGAGLDADTAAIVFISPLGAALGMQILGGLLLVTGRKIPSVFGALLILSAFSTVGHAASHGGLARLAVIAHVAGLSWWFAGLWALFKAGRTHSASTYIALVLRFSRQAVWIWSSLGSSPPVCCWSSNRISIEPMTECSPSRSPSP